METITAYLFGTPAASLIFVVTLVTSFLAFRDQGLLAKFMFTPYVIKRKNQYSRFLTHGLIHADLMHLGFNMLTFFFFAFYFEMMLGAWWKFAAFYLIALVVSSISSYIKNKDNPSYHSLGASGATSAIVLGWVMFNPLEKLLIFFFPMPGWLFAILYIGYSQYAAKKNQDNIGHEAHLWGAITGIVLTLIFRPDVINVWKQLLG